MSFNELMEFFKEKLRGKDVSGAPQRLAVQFDITGENGGVMYAEIKNGELKIEPYEYNDRDVKIIIGGEDFVKLLNKELNPVLAFTLGKLKVEGDVGKALEITNLL